MRVKYLTTEEAMRTTRLKWINILDRPKDVLWMEDDVGEIKGISATGKVRDELIEKESNK